MGDTHPDPRRPADAPREAPAAARLARAARAAEELCATLWEAMHEELGMHEEPCLPRARRVGELAERLAQVCSALAALASQAQTPELEIAIHDTRREGPRVSVAPGGADLRTWVEPGGESIDWEPRSPAHPPVHAHLPRVGGEGSIAQAIEASLERHTADGLPFAVLLVEVPDVERLAQAEPPAELVRMLEAVERAVGPELRPSDTLVREGRGRWWLTASRTNAPGARTLAERLARTVRTVASHRGVPLDLAVGIAVCPADGRDVETLVAHADVGLYAARAAGRSVAPGDDAV